ncbi:MAG: hypothetical protein IJI26_00925 [Clostridia bacterium]|nr:hypothetical protein [Clostridia bacterium]
MRSDCAGCRTGKGNGMRSDLNVNKRRAGILVDGLMFLLLILQMLYVFTGNVAHEVLGIAFFACLALHIILKRRWLTGLTGKGRKQSAGRKWFNAVTALLLMTAAALMVSAMDVSRTLFPNVLILGSADLHRYLATAVLTLSVLHGGLSVMRRTKKKKLLTIVMIALMILSLVLGLALVPYMNRHLKTVEVDRESTVSGEQLSWTGEKPLVVYFTRLGNTDLAPDVDAVSGASLLLADGELMGSDQLLAEMVQDAIGCEARAITLTGEKYPSSYGATVVAAQRELRQNSRPGIEPIDVSEHDGIILIYPLWWGSIPMPVASFLESSDLTGKTIYLIATQGSSGFGASANAIRTLCPGADVREGISIYCEDIPGAREQIGRYLQSILP